MRQLIAQLTFGLFILFFMTANAAKLPAPSELCQPNQKKFAEYLRQPPHKAFAVSSDGSYGWSAGKSTVAEAKSEALGFCQKHTYKVCRIYSVDDALL